MLSKYREENVVFPIIWNSRYTNMLKRCESWSGLVLTDFLTMLHVLVWLSAAITPRIVGRPTREELKERNILPGGRSHPSLHAAAVSLERAKAADTLNRKIELRPSKEEVIVVEHSSRHDDKINSLNFIRFSCCHPLLALQCWLFLFDPNF